MRCHYEFHLSMGMAAIFIVEDGPTESTSLPAPPSEFLTCNHAHRLVPNELYLKNTNTTGARVNEAWEINTTTTFLNKHIIMTTFI